MRRQTTGSSGFFSNTRCQRQVVGSFRLWLAAGILLVVCLRLLLCSNPKPAVQQPSSTSWKYLEETKDDRLFRHTTPDRLYTAPQQGVIITSEVSSSPLPSPSVQRPSHPRTNRTRYLQNPDSTRALIQSLDRSGNNTPHFLTTLSGCRIARWILPIRGQRPERRDCYKEVQMALEHQISNPRILTQETMTRLRTNDTIYATYDQVRDFVQDLLPFLTVDVVLISGQREYIWAPLQSTIDAVLQHPHVLYWFCQNLPKYGGTHPHHPKLASFPFGIKQRVTDDPLQPTNGAAYQQVFQEALHPNFSKNRTLFAGYVTVMSNARDRANIPASSTVLLPVEFYRATAQSRYIPSPNGDRPECYRHYEALGLGTAPITQLSREQGLFAHFEGIGLLYQEDFYSSWMNNASASWKDLLEKRIPVVVHRNVVLEEYWMEYVDWYVDRILTWWDRYHPEQGGPTTMTVLLHDFVSTWHEPSKK